MSIGFKKKLFQLLQIGVAEKELFYCSIKSDHYLGIILYRLAAHHHPFTKLVVVYMVSRL